jgi:hypothetical protein
MGRKSNKEPNPELFSLAERIKSKVPASENPAQYIHRKMNSLGYPITQVPVYEWIGAYKIPSEARQWIGLARVLDVSIDWLMTGEVYRKPLYLRVQGRIIEENGNPSFVSETRVVEQKEFSGPERRKDGTIYLEIK